MRNVWKALACLLAFALFTYLILFDYPSMKQGLLSQSTGNPQVGADLPAEDEDADQDAETSSLTQEADPQKAEAQLDALLDQCAPTKVTLCFRQIDASAYETLYPLLNQHGLVGALVLHDGQLPGDNGKISTADCWEMANNGWMFVVGDNGDIDMSADPEDAAAALGEYLDSYLSRIWVRIAVKVDTFMFDEGEYRESFDEVLESRGFTRILYVPDGETQVSSTDSLEKIPYYTLSQSADLEEAVQTAKRYGSVALSTRLVEAEIPDETLDCTIDRYEALLQALAEDGLTEVTALSEVSGSTEAEVKARTELLEQIEALEAALE